MQFKATKVEGALRTKGFRQEEGRHHNFVYVTLGGKTSSIITHTSHNSQDISNRLIGDMKRQMKLDSSEEFRKFVQCPMKRLEYEKLLIERGHIPGK